MRRPWKRRFVASITGCVLALTSLALGQPPESLEESSNATRLKAMQQAVGRLVIKPTAGDRPALELRAEPVFRWNSPLSRVSDGAVFVWLSDNRPELLGCVFLKDGSAILELQSLSDRALISKLERKTIWAPAEPGIEWTEIADAATPAATKMEQLRQIKNLATDFSVHAVKTPPDYQDGSIWHFRLMPRPIFEYGDNETNRGAIFAFSQGTDPEAFLLIESRKNSGGNLRWHFAFGASCVWELHGRHLDREVWNRPKCPCFLDSIYTIVRPFPVSLDSVPESK